MYPFIETIRIEDGQIYNLDYHTVQSFGKILFRLICVSIYRHQF